jgi:hypothetical protein
MKKLSLFILFAIFVTACGKQGSQKNSASEIPLFYEEQYNEYVKRSSLDQETPNGVGMLFIKKDTIYGKGMGVCTWFLVGENIAMTNSHCIPAEVINGGCEEVLGGVFKTENGDEKRVCKKVIHASPIAERSFDLPDYALIELDRPINTNVFAISRKGIVEDEELTIHSIDSVSNGGSSITGKYRKQTCFPKSSHFFGNFMDQLSFVIPVFDSGAHSDVCNVIQGNSGSAVVGSDGDVKAVAFAGKTKELKLDREIFDVEKIENMGLVTNLACVKFNIEKMDADRSADCDSKLVKDLASKRNKMNQISEETVDDLQTQINKLVAKLPKAFKYDVQMDTLGSAAEQGINIKPKCMVEYDKWPEAEKDKTKRHGFLWLKRKYETTIPLYQSKTTFKVNKYAQMDTSTKIVKVGDSKVTIKNTKDIGKKPKKIVSWTHFLFNSKLTFKLNIGLCK